VKGTLKKLPYLTAESTVTPFEEKDVIATSSILDVDGKGEDSNLSQDHWTPPRW